MVIRFNQNLSGVNATDSQFGKSENIGFSENQNELSELLANTSAQQEPSDNYECDGREPRNTGANGQRKTAPSFFQRVPPFSWIFGRKNKDGGSASCQRVIDNSPQLNPLNSSKEIDRSSKNPKPKLLANKDYERRKAMTGEERAKEDRLVREAERNAKKDGAKFNKEEFIAALYKPEDKTENKTENIAENKKDNNTLILNLGGSSDTYAKNGVNLDAESDDRPEYIDSPIPPPQTSAYNNKDQKDKKFPEA